MALPELFGAWLAKSRQQNSSPFPLSSERGQSRVWLRGSLPSIGRWHLAAGIGAIGACPIARICQKHCPGRRYLSMLCFSLFYELFEAARNLQKHASRCKVGMMGCRLLAARYIWERLLAQ